MSTDRMQQLLTRYSDGTATPEERAEVDRIFNYILQKVSLEESLSNLECKRTMSNNDKEARDAPSD